jgi:hypothetical protein
MASIVQALFSAFPRLTPEVESPVPRPVTLEVQSPLPRMVHLPVTFPFDFPFCEPVSRPASPTQSVASVGLLDFTRATTPDDTPDNQELNDAPWEPLNPAAAFQAWVPAPPSPQFTAWPGQIPTGSPEYVVRTPGQTPSPRPRSPFSTDRPWNVHPGSPTGWTDASVMPFMGRSRVLEDGEIESDASSIVGDDMDIASSTTANSVPPLLTPLGPVSAEQWTNELNSFSNDPWHIALRRVGLNPEAHPFDPRRIISDNIDPETGDRVRRYNLDTDIEDFLTDATSPVFSSTSSSSPSPPEEPPVYTARPTRIPLYRARRLCFKCGSPDHIRRRCPLVRRGPYVRVQQIDQFHRQLSPREYDGVVKKTFIDLKGAILRQQDATRLAVNCEENQLVRRIFNRVWLDLARAEDAFGCPSRSTQV